MILSTMHAVHNTAQTALLFQPRIYAFRLEFENLVYLGLSV